MRFGFIAKHRGIWPVAWLCAALGVSKSGFHAWLGRGPSAHAKADEALMPKVRASFIGSSRTYGARRVWRDVLAGCVSGDDKKQSENAGPDHAGGACHSFRSHHHIHLLMPELNCAGAAHRR